MPAKAYALPPYAPVPPYLPSAATPKSTFLQYATLATRTPAPSSKVAFLSSYSVLSPIPAASFGPLCSHQYSLYACRFRLIASLSGCALTVGTFLRIPLLYRQSFLQLLDSLQPHLRRGRTRWLHRINRFRRLHVFIRPRLL